MTLASFVTTAANAIRKVARPTLRAQIFAAIVLLAVCYPNAPVHAGPHAAGPGTNPPVPDVTFRTSQDESVRTTDLKGDVVFVSLWATGCKACAAMRGSVERLNQQFAAQGVRFLSINEDAARQSWKDFMAQNPSASIEVWDKDHTFRHQLHARRLPAALIVDRNGQIRWRSDWTADTEAKALAQLSSLLQEPQTK